MKKSDFSELADHKASSSKSGAAALKSSCGTCSNTGCNTGKGIEASLRNNLSSILHIARNATA